MALSEGASGLLRLLWAAPYPAMLLTADWRIAAVNDAFVDFIHRLPLDRISQAGICGYCDSKITSGRFDWVLAMDGANLSWLQQRQPKGWAGRAELLLAHARPAPPALDVPDPYYGTAAGFDKVLDLVEAACDGVVEALRQHLAQSDRGRRDA